MKGFLFFKTNYISVLFFDRHEKVKSLEGETDEDNNENDFEIIYNWKKSWLDLYKKLKWVNLPSQFVYFFNNTLLSGFCSCQEFVIRSR
jgi:hypothetical protein